MARTMGETHDEFAAVRGEIQALRADVSRHFTWLVGIQIASLIAIVSALIRLS